MLAGFDIGGTKCAVVVGQQLSDGSIQVLGRHALPTRGSAATLLATLAGAVPGLLAAAGYADNPITGIGISCGGPLDSRTGMILSPPNLPGWDNIPVTTILSELLHAPAILQNDANACAVAEWRYGAGMGSQNMVFLTFGTGMGAGLILGGRLYSGTNDLAGEVGHWRLADDGPEGYGKRGSFEGFWSGGGIARMAQKRAKEVWATGGSVAFCSGPEAVETITAQAVAAAAIEGDPIAREVFGTSARYLGRGLGLMIDMLNPEVIVIGSIFARAEVLFRSVMEEVIFTETLQGAQSVCRIVPAALGDEIGDVAALAVAAMAAGEVG